MENEAMSQILQVNEVFLRYDGRNVVDNVSFSVDTGDFYVIIGPNGAGKTTLLKMIGGLEKPAAGSIILCGRDISTYSRKKLSRLVAVVPQQLPVGFPFTVLETVLMGRTPHLGLMAVERPVDFRIAEEAMVFTDVIHLAGRNLSQLSGGELQRVVIARAICQQPRLILLDEPTTALDPAHQLKIMDLMERFRQEQNITVVMISHDLNLAASYGNRLLLLKDGRVEKCGGPRDVLTESRLEESYGCVMQVDENPLGPSVRITLVPEKFLGKPRCSS